MRSISLTRRQRDLFRFIESYIAERGMGPSYEEMCAHMGLASKPGVHRLLRDLEERGAIECKSNRARAIRVTEAACRAAHAHEVVLSSRIDAALREYAQGKGHAPADVIVRAVAHLLASEGRL